jgi:hypothetical protein
MVGENSGVHLNPEDLNDTLELEEDDLPTPKLGNTDVLVTQNEPTRFYAKVGDRSVYVVNFVCFN